VEDSGKVISSDDDSASYIMALVTQRLTLILLTWKIWCAPNNASRWQIGFNSAFKELKMGGRTAYAII